MSVERDRSDCKGGNVVGTPRPLEVSYEGERDKPLFSIIP